MWPLKFLQQCFFISTLMDQTPKKDGTKLNNFLYQAKIAFAKFENHCDVGWIIKKNSASKNFRWAIHLQCGGKNSWQKLLKMLSQFICWLCRPVQNLGVQNFYHDIKIESQGMGTVNRNTFYRFLESLHWQLLLWLSSIVNFMKSKLKILLHATKTSYDHVICKSFNF